MRLRAGVASDRGLVRSVNEDSFFLREGLYAVCDGMGGARGGEVASQMACLGLIGLNPASAGQQDLREAVSNANRAIIRRSFREHHLLGMGTTLTAVLVRGEQLTLAHVGDSRAYLLHRGDLTQLSEDHSWVGEMVRRGDLTPAQAAIHPHRSVITRALGTDEDTQADLIDVPIDEGDRILICSDGLTNMVPDTDLLEVLESGQDAQKTAELLVQAALAGGGEDNVTVVVVDVLPDVEEADGEHRDGGSRSGQILFGPSDRGAMVTASSHRLGRSGVRERLNRMSLPSLRPVVSRSAHDHPADEDWPPVPEALPADSETTPGGQQPGEPRGGEGEKVTAAGQEAAPPAVPAPGAAPPPAPAPEAAPPTLAADSEPKGVSTPTAAGGPVQAAESKPSGKGWLRGRRRKWLLFTLAVVLILAILVAGFAVYNSSVYYVGTYADGTVALYRGLPHSVLGIDLSYAIELGTFKYDALTSTEQQQVDSHNLVSKEDGQMFLQSLVPQP